MAGFLTNYHVLVTLRVMCISEVAQVDTPTMVGQDETALFSMGLPVKNCMPAK
jgi:hypothetical protein